MVDIYAVLKVNDGETGELIVKANDIVRFDDIKSVDDLTDNDREDIAKHLIDIVGEDTLTGHFVSRVSFVELADDYNREVEA